MLHWDEPFCVGIHLPGVVFECVLVALQTRPAKILDVDQVESTGEVEERKMEDAPVARRSLSKALRFGLGEFQGTHNSSGEQVLMMEMVDGFHWGYFTPISL